MGLALLGIGVYQRMLLLVEVLPHPQELPHLHPHQQQDVDLLNGLMTNGVMMKTTMLIAIMMVELAASTTFQVGTNIALTVPAWIPMQLELHQPRVQISNQQNGVSERKIKTSVTDPR